MEKLLVTQALDERDLLKKKINDTIRKANLVATQKVADTKIYGRSIGVDDFKKEAESRMQKINDLIARYEAIDSAILLSNATTEIEVAGKKMTKASAINLRKTLRESNYSSDDSTDFRGTLITKLEHELRKANLDIADSRTVADKQRDLMTQNMSAGDKSKLTSDSLESIEKYCNSLIHVLVDPVDAEKRLEKLVEERDALIKDIETAIKVSNATTYIEF